MPTFLRRLIARIKYRHFQRDLDQELAAHRAMVEDDLRARGLSPDDATPAAARALGNVTYMREEARGVWIAHWLEQLWQDVRYAGRQYRQQPGHAVAAVLTLGVALGLVTSVFAVFNSLYLRTWDVPDAKSLIVVSGRTDTGWNFTSFSLDQYRRLHEAITATDLAAFEHSTFIVGNGAETELRVDGHWVSADFIRVVQLGVAVGAGLDGASAEPRVVISDRLWRSLFGNRPDVVGQAITVAGKSATVSGVLERGFKGLPPDHSDILVNLGARDYWQPGWSAPAKSQELQIVGRPRTGFTRNAAVSELASAGPALLEPTVTSVRGLQTTFADLKSVPSTVPRVLGLVFLGTALVLALACANVGSMQMARGVKRQRELTIRLSLGASRGRVVRQLLIESLVMTVAAACLGLWMSTLLPSLVLSFDTSTYLWIWTPDPRMYLFSAIATTATCAAFAIAPALHSCRAARLVSHSAAPSAAGRTRSLILSTQIACAISLVLAASLLARGVIKTARSDGGYALRDLAVAFIIKPTGTYDAARNRALLLHLTRELGAAAPATLALTEHPPLANRVATLEDASAGRLRGMSMTSQAFEVLGLKLLAGRIFVDVPEAKEVVVNESLASRLWPGVSPLGRRVADHLVVGVSADARLTDATRSEPLFFRAIQSPSTYFITFRRNRGAEDRVRHLLAAFDPRLTIRLQPLSEAVMDDLRGSILGTTVAGALAVLALLLAIVGVFGVASFIVEERRREIGVRLALGAGRAHIRGAVATQVRWPLIGGVAAGLVMSVLGGTTMRAFLIDISPFDPVSYAVVGLVILAAGAAAAAVPMRRALSVDPAITLRSE